MKISNLAQRRRRLSLRDKESRRRRLRVECLEDRRLLASDFGDAPSPFPTLAADNGARHADDWIQTGSSIIGESASEQSARSISLNSDGTRVAIGSYQNDGAFENSGHVRIYERADGNWIQLGNDIDGQQVHERSGYSVSLSGDGQIVAIGSINNSGTVRVFRLEAGVWTQIGSDINGEGTQDKSGYSVSLNHDGSIVAIGAPNNNGGGDFSGQARVFQYSNSSWLQLGNSIEGVANSFLGRSVALSASGNRLVVSAPFEVEGRVRIFDFDGSEWLQIGGDVIGEADGDIFGRSVAINGQGNIIAVGADYNQANGTESGHVRVYELAGNTWTQIGVDLDGEQPYHQFGFSVALNTIGDTLAVGAPHRSSGGEDNPGGVTVYKRSANNWVQVGERLTGSLNGAVFGSSVSIDASGNHVAIGIPRAPNPNSGGAEWGAVDIYSIGSQSLRLGAEKNLELDGRVSANADGDGDSDDGVIFEYLMIGQTHAGVAVNVQNAASDAKLDAWIDFNGDGIWSTTQEQIFDSVPVTNGDNQLEFSIPGDVPSGSTFARFRLSTLGGLFVTGSAVDGEVEDYQIVINANSIPTLDPVDDVSILEDSLEQIVSFAGVTAGGADDQHLDVTAVSDNTALIPNPSVTYSTPDTTGTLAFTPIADQHGTATITVTVQDGGGDNNLDTTEDNASFSQAFTISVNPVNDAPTLEIPPDIVFDEDGVVHGNGTNLKLFASDIDSDQTKLEFRIVNLAEIDSQFGLSIGMDPQSDSFVPRSDNTIHVHPAGNFFGSTQVTIEARDPEGAVSNQQTFVLTINAVNDPPTLDPTSDLTLVDVIEDSGAPVGEAGTLVSTLIDENGPVSNFSDIDGVAAGIAVVGKNIAVEKVWFSTDDGQHWQEVGSVSDSEALVLFADASTRLYAQTAADFSGDLADALKIKAWDQTGGYSNGQAGVDSTTNAFSSATDTVSLSIVASPSSAVDDFYAPEFNSGETFDIAKADLIANDTLGNGESIDTVTITADTTSAAGGTISVDGDTFTYTRPSSWFTGIDTFAYTLDDGGSESSATVTILSGLVGDTLTITLEPGRDHEVTLQYSDDKLVMVDHVTQTTLLNIPRELVPVNVEVVGAPANANIVTFKELSGQTPGETNTSWSYQGGSTSDELAVLGTGSQWAWLSSDPQVENDITVELKLLTTLIDTYTMIAVEKVHVGQVDRIELSDPYLEVGGQTFDLGSSKPVNLPTDVTISEGVLRSSTPVGPHVGESIVGSGHIDAVFAGGVGSLIRLTGNLAVGDAGSTAGFRTDGFLEVGENIATLLDSNQAELGSLTTLGNELPGTLISDNGLILEFGDNLQGYGTIQSEANGTIINNGSIVGNSGEQPITINSRVKGVGTFDNVVMNGEFTPGFSPALWKSGTVAYTDLNRFVIELGGRIAGAEFDRVEHYLAKLGGTLDVQLIDGFKPALGDLLEVITSEQPFEGNFKEILLPLQENGVRIREILDQHGISLETVYDVVETLEVLKSQVADYEIAGHDGSGLRIQGDRFRAFVTSLHQFVAEHSWHTEELELQAGQLVQVATDGINRLIIEGSNWKNFVKPSDVNNDQNVSALDALTVINELGRRSHSDDLTFELDDAAILVTGEGHFYDQNGDGKCTALDALRVINELARISNGGSGEGESVTADYLTGNAADVWTQDFRSQGTEAVQDDSEVENESEESHLLYSDDDNDSPVLSERPEDLVYATAGKESTEAVDSLLSELEDWWK
ncbi:Ig-like domain-containing protein [Rubripirellula sp.]|nr:Ig-like domain-containing protein [Rubripirellula sp.]